MILAVAGGKGGVGKSTVAYNLGAALDAVVVDADLGMADLPVGRGPDLHDVLAGRATALEAVDESGPVTLLPCGRSLAGARACQPAALCGALDAVERAYRRVVVDCPAGLSADVGLPLLAADRYVLVTLPDRVAVPDAMRAAALARELGAGLDSVVLNRCDDGNLAESVERRFGAPVTCLPESDAVRTAARTGRPVTTSAPESVVARRIRRRATAIRTTTGDE